MYSADTASNAFLLHMLSSLNHNDSSCTLHDAVGHLLPELGVGDDGLDLPVGLGVDLDGGVTGDLSDTVEAVQVLVAGDLEDRRASLASDNDGVGKEVRPDTEPPDAVLGHNLLLVREPVEVPPVDGGRVVDAEDVDRLDLKVGRLELRDDPSEGERGVRTGEDVLVHA